MRLQLPKDSVMSTGLFTEAGAICPACQIILDWADIRERAPTKGRGDGAVGDIVMGCADAPRGEHEAAGPHAQSQPEHCAGNVRFIVRHTLYPHEIHSTAGMPRNESLR